MTTTSLPDRLRALADLIDTHNLPSLPMAVSDPEHYVSLHARSVADVEAWASALGVTVGTIDYPDDPDGPWVAHVASMDYLTAGPVHVSVQFSEHTAAVPA